MEKTQKETKSELEKEVLQQIAVPLLLWYRENARALPWRESSEPYRIWVSEIMLQQTRVEAVKPYYDRFLSALPDIAALAAASEERLLKLWEGLGYYSRARNLQKAARKVMEEHGGVLPADYEQLKLLPGIGEYTAGAIASIAFGAAVPVVDGNVLRVISRVTGSFEQIDTSACKKRIWQQLYEILPKDAPGDFNQALMELGAIVCLPSGEPLCRRCPWEGLCLARKNGWIEQIPARTPKRQKKQEERTVLLLWQEGKVALRRRPSKGLLAGMWEFPSLPGKLEAREVLKALEGQGADAWKIEELASARHIFTHIVWEMKGYGIELARPPRECGLQFWEPEALINQAALPSAFRVYTGLVRHRAQSQKENKK